MPLVSAETADAGSTSGMVETADAGSVSCTAETADAGSISCTAETADADSTSGTAETVVNVVSASGITTAGEAETTSTLSMEASGDVIPVLLSEKDLPEEEETIQEAVMELRSGTENLPMNSGEDITFYPNGMEIPELETGTSEPWNADAGSKGEKPEINSNAWKAESAGSEPESESSEPEPDKSEPETGAGESETDASDPESDVSISEPTDNSPDLKAEAARQETGEVQYLYAPATVRLFQKEMVSKPEEIRLTEKSPGVLNRHSVYITYNRTCRLLKEGQEYEVALEKSGNGYAYRYRIYTSNFAKEGSYAVTICSRDQNGRIVTNAVWRNHIAADRETGTSAQADCFSPGFIVDGTAPTCSIAGLRSKNTKISAEKINVTVLPRDNVSVAEVGIRVNGGEETNYSGERLEEAMTEGNGGICVQLRPAAAAQKISVRAADGAGNESTCAWRFTLRQRDSSGLRAAAAASVSAAFVSGIVFALTVYKKRKMGIVKTEQM